MLPDLPPAHNTALSERRPLVVLDDQIFFYTQADHEAGFAAIFRGVPQERRIVDYTIHDLTLYSDRPTGGFSESRDTFCQYALSVAIHTGDAHYLSLSDIQIQGFEGGKPAIVFGA